MYRLDEVELAQVVPRTPGRLRDRRRRLFVAERVHRSRRRSIERVEGVGEARQPGATTASGRAHRITRSRRVGGRGPATGSRVDFLTRRIDVVEIATEAGGRIHFGPPKTRAGRRTVPMPKHVAEALEEHATRVASDELVFAGPKGGALRGSAFRRRVWQPAVKKAGLLPLRPHDLRHTAVAFWIAAGAQPLEVARRAGHTSVVVVLDRYGHLLPRADDPVTDALDELAAGAKAKPAATVRAIGVRSRTAAGARKWPLTWVGAEGFEPPTSAL
jgi:Phage integrase family